MGGGIILAVLALAVPAYAGGLPPAGGSLRDGRPHPAAERATRGVVYGPPNPASAIKALAKYGISTKAILAIARRRPDAKTQRWIQQAAGQRTRSVERMFANRRALLGTLGGLVSPLGQRPASRDGWVYYFVSSSMPESLLRAYAHDSVWTGGVLVFRGVPPGHGLAWFVHHIAAPLLANRSAEPTLVIDPRLYQAFDVRMVPTIVYSVIKPAKLCSSQRWAGLPGAKRSARECALAPAANYWKVEGAVSSVWALRAFGNAGAPGVGTLLRISQFNAPPMSGRPELRDQPGMSAQVYATAQTPGSALRTVKLLSEAPNTLRGVARDGPLWWQKAIKFPRGSQ